MACCQCHLRRQKRPFMSSLRNTCSSNLRFPLVLLIAVEPMFLAYCVESKISSPSRFCFVCSNIIDDLSGLSSHNT